MDHFQNQRAAFGTDPREPSKSGWETRNLKTHLFSQFVAFGPNLRRGSPNHLQSLAQLVDFVLAFDEGTSSHEFGQNAAQGENVYGTVVVGGV